MTSSAIANKDDNPEDFVRVALFLIAVALFVSGVILSFRGFGVESASTYSAAALLLLFAFLAKFKRFKALGVEAELWEEKQEEAATLIENLKRTSAAISYPVMVMSARMGRPNSRFSRQDHFDFMRELEGSLISAGIDANEIERMKSDWHVFNVVDLAAPIKRVTSEEFNKKANFLISESDKFAPGDKKISRPEAQACRTELLDAEAELNKLLGAIPSDGLSEIPGRLATWLENLPVFSSMEKQDLRMSIEPEIEDIKYYVETKRIRRPEVFFAEDSG